MAWCGFDEMMRTGVGVYAKGVARAIETKAESCGVSVACQLEKERSELGTLEKLINNRLKEAVDDPAMILQLRAFVGLVSVARFLIEKSPQPSGTSANNLSFDSDAYTLATLIDIFDKEYTLLPQEDGHPKNAAIALNKIFPVQSVQIELVPPTDNLSPSEPSLEPTI